jgi:nucleoside triphosphate diphosphatase
MSEMKNRQGLTRLLAIMKQLRDPIAGCPWDLEQDFATIAPYTIEEAYEVADAIERKAYEELKGELGDLLLQVVFHSQIASERKLFEFGDVVDAIANKMIDRHPHVFADRSTDDAAAVTENWEAAKAAERKAQNLDQSDLAGVALALPALIRAEKIQRRAARTGFDWPDQRGAVAKLHEEIAELEAAENSKDQFEEFGDVLFSAVNVARHLNIDAETALKAATAKFERRFRGMETIAGGQFSELTAEDKEQLWVQIKSAECG